MASGDLIVKVADKDTLDRTYANTNAILAAVGEDVRIKGVKRYGMKINKNDSNPATRCTYLFDAVGMTPVVRGEGYHGLHVSQEVVTDNERYYTVKLSVLETEASGYENNQFYTIDKQTGNVVTLEDLFVEGSDYISAISENIKTQMQEQMAADEGVIYFLDNDDMPEFNFQGITEQTNFYFNEKDELVIAFDEYEVAPGSMGAPEFVIPQEVTAAILK